MAELTTKRRKRPFTDEEVQSLRASIDSRRAEFALGDCAMQMELALGQLGGNAASDYLNALDRANQLLDELWTSWRNDCLAGETYGRTYH